MEDPQEFMNKFYLLTTGSESSATSSHVVTVNVGQLAHRFWQGWSIAECVEQSCMQAIRKAMEECTDGLCALDTPIPRHRDAESQFHNCRSKSTSTRSSKSPSKTMDYGTLSHRHGEEMKIHGNLKNSTNDSIKQGNESTLWTRPCREWSTPTRFTGSDVSWTRRGKK